MKKLIPLALIVTLGMSGAALAKTSLQGGFNDGTPRTEVNMNDSQKSSNKNFGENRIVSATTVTDAKNLADDAWVVLKGKIIKQVGKNEYIFKDATGEIQVEINKKKWKGQQVTPENLVEISGKVDKKLNQMEIYVKHIQMLPPV